MPSFSPQDFLDYACCRLSIVFLGRKSLPMPQFAFAYYRRVPDRKRCKLDIDVIDQTTVVL